VEDENLKIILDAVRHKYDAVADVDNSLNGGLGTLLGFEVTLIIGYTIFCARSSKWGQTTNSHFGSCLLGFSIACLLAARFLQRKSYLYPSQSLRQGIMREGRPENCSYLIEEGHTASVEIA